MAFSKDPPGVFPSPLIIPPASSHHQTFIILHGRGSTAARFSPPLLTTIDSTTNKTLQQAFPHARLVFLTASRNRATIYKRAYTHQWFDNWHLERRNERQDLQADGLAKSVAFVHEILRYEVEEVGSENVVLWGLSQGCATALASLLACDREPLAAVVGMCGWLPYENLIAEVVGGREREGPENDESDDVDESRSDSESDESGGEQSDYDSTDEDEDEDIIQVPFPVDEPEEDDDPFEREDPELSQDHFTDNHEEDIQDIFSQLTIQTSNTTNSSPSRDSKIDLPTQAINYWRAAIDMESKPGMVFHDTPVFLGHGTEDERVTIELGREAKACLENLGVDVKMVEYEGLGHWYSEDMMGDISEFLREKLRIKN